MQKFVLSTVFVIFSLSLMNAQSKFTVGLGASQSIFVPTTEENSIYENDNYLSPHLHFKYEPISFGRFSGQVQANFYIKYIGIASKEKNQEELSIARFKYEYLSTDLVLSVIYNHPISETLLFKPRLGYFFSYNHYSTIIEHYHSGSGVSIGNDIGRFDLFEGSSFTNSGIMAGFSFDRLKNRSISLFADFYFSPQDVLPEVIVYHRDGVGGEIQGEFHYLNVGIRYGLDKF
ncbi:MAG: hypothetical protein AB8G11_18395 [Saprospiraceae bacterium]